MTIINRNLDRAIETQFDCHGQSIESHRDGLTVTANVWGADDWDAPAVRARLPHDCS